MARGGAGGRMIGSKVALPADRHFSSPEEIAARDKQTHQMPPTTGNITGPEDQEGKNFGGVDAGFDNKTTGGNKFSQFKG